MESLYRKYRPQTFEQVVGQSHVVSTLERAVTEGRVSHAYLFCGPRGTGKTTMARIVAKALMCEQGEGHLPDGTCEECQLIAAGEHPDVYELDAASRTGVDNVREEIISRVDYAPVRGRYKVYIIDEVHMLTPAAFNALLKTLEEPPAHVVFIMCTTDPQKILATILSRVQRFDFHSIAPQEMHDHLVNVCNSEGFTFDDEALQIVVRHARGGMRDALSSLEQLSVFGAGHIGADSARDLLGETAGSALAGVSRSLAARDVPALFGGVAELVNNGGDLLQFTRELAARVRNDYVVSVAGAKPGVVDAPEGELAELAEEAAAYGSSDRLARVLTVLGDAINEMRTAVNQRLVLEIALTRCARPESDLTLESLAERVDRLERGGVVGAATAPVAAAAAAMAPVPGQAAPAVVPTAAGAAASAASVPAAQPAAQVLAGQIAPATGAGAVPASAAPSNVAPAAQPAAPAPAGQAAPAATGAGVAPGVQAAAQAPAGAPAPGAGAPSAPAGGAPANGGFVPPKLVLRGKKLPGVASALDSSASAEPSAAPVAPQAAPAVPQTASAAAPAASVAPGAAPASAAPASAAPTAPAAGGAPANGGFVPPKLVLHGKEHGGAAASASSAPATSAGSPAGTAPVASAAPTASPEAAASDPGALQRAWKKIERAVREKNPSFGSLLLNAEADSDDGSTLTLSFPAGSAFAVKMLGRQDVRAVLDAAVASVLGPRQLATTERAAEPAAPSRPAAADLHIPESAAPTSSSPAPAAEAAPASCAAKPGTAAAPASAGEATPAPAGDSAPAAAADSASGAESASAPAGSAAPVAASGPVAAPAPTAGAPGDVEARQPSPVASAGAAPVSAGPGAVEPAAAPVGDGSDDNDGDDYDDDPSYDDYAPYDEGMPADDLPPIDVPEEFDEPEPASAPDAPAASSPAGSASSSAASKLTVPPAAANLTVPAGADTDASAPFTGGIDELRSLAMGVWGAGVNVTVVPDDED